MSLQMFMSFEFLSAYPTGWDGDASSAHLHSYQLVSSAKMMRIWKQREDKRRFHGLLDIEAGNSRPEAAENAGGEEDDVIAAFSSAVTVALRRLSISFG